MTTQQERGCFGAATVFAADSEVCQACEAYRDCNKASVETLARICSIVNVKDLIVRHKKSRDVAMKNMSKQDQEAIDAAPPGPFATPTPTKPVARAVPVETTDYAVTEKQQQIIARLPTKAHSFATTLCKRGHIRDIRTALAQGSVEFNHGIPLWLRVPLMLLSEKREFTRTDLREAYDKQLSWSKGTTASHMSLALSFLEGFELATKDDKRYVLSPTLTA